MKRICSLGKGRYIHLDSYGESHETRRSNVVVFLLASIIAAITIAAALGVDITDPSPKQHHDIHNRTGY
jgi:beta-lactamase regulating signal transducer with metallopeptidase domain